MDQMGLKTMVQRISQARKVATIKTVRVCKVWVTRCPGSRAALTRRAYIRSGARMSLSRIALLLDGAASKSSNRITQRSNSRKIKVK